MDVSNLSLFFPPGSSVLAVPNQKKPRLFLPKETMTKQWKKCGFYPATRWLARVYRSTLRFKSALGLGGIEVNLRSHWPLMEFVNGYLPDMDSVVVLMGTPGPAQKITVQLWDSKGEVIGYLKYGETSTARQRIIKEFQVLSALPRDLGPAPLKCGELGRGMALLMSPVFGKQLVAELPPPDGLNKVFKRMTMPSSYSVEEHPWIQKMQDSGISEVKNWLDSLAGQKWPSTILHGDVAPWNIIKSAQGFHLIDWEYGELDGFPYIDLIHYILQVSGLIQRLKPADAFINTLDLLTKEPFFLTSCQAESLIRLAALSAYLKEPQDKQSRENKLQVWRSEIWSIPGP